MTARSVTHATFVVERTYPASPARVFQAFADPALKARWFAPPGDPSHELDSDFRVGGREVNRGTTPTEGQTFVFEARYWDIVPNERIVYSYDMHLDGTRISVSLSTVEFQPTRSGTRLVYTEQGAFLDGLDKPEWREHGTRDLLAALAAELGGADGGE